MQVKERREKFLTAKYGSHQMALIRKRLAVEMWLYDELQKLYDSTVTCVENSITFRYSLSKRGKRTRGSPPPMNNYSIRNYDLAVAWSAFKNKYALFFNVPKLYPTGKTSAGDWYVKD